MVRLKATVLDDKKCADYVWTGVSSEGLKASTASWSTTALSSTASTSRCAQYGWTCVSASRDANRGQRPRGLHHMLCSQVRTQLGLYFEAETLKKGAIM